MQSCHDIVELSNLLRGKTCDIMPEYVIPERTLTEVHGSSTGNRLSNPIMGPCFSFACKESSA